MGTVTHHTVTPPHSHTSHITQSGTMLTLTLLPLVLFLSGASAQSCEGHCQDPFDESLPCQCNELCTQYNDCCEDYGQFCGGTNSENGLEGSCEGKCGDPFDESLPCQCNELCTQYNDCCEDYDQFCGATDSQNGQEGSCEGKCGDPFD